MIMETKSGRFLTQTCGGIFIETKTSVGFLKKGALRLQKEIC
jgi:hypothetical protein